MNTTDPTRRGFLKAAGLGIAAMALRPATSTAAKADGKLPNLIFIMADDLGYGDLGCYGQKLIQTPELDKMCAAGLKLTRFHAGFPVCLPARCTLMTGLHTGHCRTNKNGGGGKHPMLKTEDTTVATVLKTAGYTTAMVGKWSLGDDFVGCVKKHQDKDGSGAIYKHGWDYYYGEPNQTYCHRYYPNQLYSYDRTGLVDKKTDGDRLDVVPLPENSKKRTHYTHDLLTVKALEFIDAAKDKPFFLYVPYTIPHADYDVPEIEPYAKAADWSKKEKTLASMITRMDRDVGRILKRLTKHGIEKNTLVIFTSDNGPNKFPRFDSSGGLKGGKRNFTLGGLRVPGIAYWPGTIKAGTTSDHLSAFWDIMPTFAELGGVKPPAPIDGISMVPTLLGKGAQKKHNYLYFGAGKNRLIIRNEHEKRTDAEILKEAVTDVVVPKFTAK
ncbi:MAG: sulfatase-like hydrolase/transferase [Phycisphaerae bacterium]|jgi:arylsulfatase A-like enzyme|nr:sulfatase-like hydrolase/transferase [Phycisphaerae bacterium]